MFVTTTYNIAHHQALQKHPKVTVLPSISSGHKINNLRLAATATANPKHKHYSALQTALQLSDDKTMADVIEAAELKYGPVFSTEK